MSEKSEKKKRNALSNSQKAITARYRRFAEEYVRDFNATRAATAAGYSADTAESQGSRLLRNAKVDAYIKKLVEERSKATLVDAAYVVEKNKEIVQANMMRYALMGKEGMTRQEILDQIPEEVQQLVTEIKINRKIFKAHTEETINFKFMSKDRAITSLGKHTGAEVEKVEIKAAVGIGSFSDLIDRINKK